ncbi:MAG: HigA family addiction module antitoxin [Actinomycetia bacterium]|nr:HigA family addiction module antitoxin [Actinomycetes bacterium]
MSDVMRTRRPTHPGEMLREEYMPDFGLSVRDLAELLGVSRQSINELVGERRALSTEMAIRLSALFGSSPESWLNLQRNVDVWDASHRLESEIKQIRRLSA